MIKTESEGLQNDLKMHTLRWPLQTFSKYLAKLLSAISTFDGWVISHRWEESWGIGNLEGDGSVDFLFELLGVLWLCDPRVDCICILFLSLLYAPQIKEEKDNTLSDLRIYSSRWFFSLRISFNLIFMNTSSHSERKTYSLQRRHLSCTDLCYNSAQRWH